jgi:large subunit ribosomal protein L21
MYAVIETGGKQYRVEVGTELAVELLDARPGDAITLDRVLLVADGDATSVGRPVVDGATVSAEVVRLDRADKVISFKYRPKARRRVKKGHRQEQTILRITDLVVDGRSAAEAARKAESAAKTERERLEEAAARQAAEDAALAAKLAARTKAAEAETAGAETTEAAPPKSRRRKAAAKETTETAGAETTEAAAEETTEAPATEASTTEAAETPEATPARAPKRSRTKKDE